MDAVNSALSALAVFSAQTGRGRTGPAYGFRRSRQHADLARDAGPARPDPQLIDVIN